MTRKQKKLKAGLSSLFSSPVRAQPAETPANNHTSTAKTSAPAAVETAAIETPSPSGNNGASRPAPEATSAKEPLSSLKKTVSDEYSGDEKQLVVFKLGDEFYGVDISIVESIIKAQRITLVPHAHDFVDGVTNLRGIIVPVVDLRTRLGMARVETTKDTRVVVVEHKGSVVGITVDAVTEVLQLSSRVIEPPSQFVTGLDAAYIVGIAKFPERLITLLDLGKIFAAADAVEK